MSTTGPTGATPPPSDPNIRATTGEDGNPEAVSADPAVNDEVQEELTIEEKAALINNMLSEEDGIENLSNFFDNVPLEEKQEIFKHLDLSKLLLMVGVTNNFKKDGEMDTLQTKLENMYNAIDYLNNELSKANKEAGKDKGKYEWPDQAKEYGNAVMAGTDEEAEFPTDADEAVDALSNYAKSIGEDAKKVSAEVSQLRADMNALMETMSSILKTLAKAKEKAISSGA